jgi:hypothetical protein
LIKNNLKEGILGFYFLILYNKYNISYNLKKLSYYYKYIIIYNIIYFDFLGNFISVALIGDIQ